jgi:uncharacterized repeat protein (TIGR02543 family)
MKMKKLHNKLTFPVGKVFMTAIMPVWLCIPPAGAQSGAGKDFRAAPAPVGNTISTQSGVTAVIDALADDDYPDNIVTPNCAVPVTGEVWTINQNPTMLGNNNVSTYQTPYVGDLDGDGHVEIVVARSYIIDGGGSGRPWSYYANGIYVFDRGNNTESLIETPAFATQGRGQIALAKPDVSEEGLIVVAAMDGYLYAFKKASTAPVWKSNAPYTTLSASPDVFNAASIMFSDFDGDGNAEIVTGDRIFDLKTGVLLLDCTFLAGRDIMLPCVSVTDVTGDRRPELVWGGNVYSINITDRTGTAGNTYALRSSVTDQTALAGLPNTSVTLTAPIDIDLDGKIDILAYGTAYFYAYDPATGDIKVRQAIPPVDRGNGSPFVGNIDKDKYPEIMYGVTGYPSYNIVAWDIDAIGLRDKSATVKWRRSTTDDSGGTGLTLFDFNQDETFEILYRDMNTLRIFNGFDQETMKTPLASIPCNSGTLSEYPVTADVDNDGEAEIIVTGSPGDGTRGYLYIFKAGTGARWAPARKVWNQYAYNSVNINEDLTVPTGIFDIATIMAGKDSIVGTDDDVQPFNGFLKQSTMIDRHGNMIMFTPDAVFAGRHRFAYDAAGDSMTVRIRIANVGESAFRPPFYTTVYKDSIAPANAITTDSIMTSILPGDTIDRTIVIRRFSSLQPVRHIVLHPNDRGGGVPMQTECRHDNNPAAVPASQILMARNDYVVIAEHKPLVIRILENDSIPAGCNPVPEFFELPAHGTMTLDGDSIRYEFKDSTFIGLDRFAYRIVCDGDTSQAKIHISVIENPDNISKATCYIAAPATVWDIEKKTMSNVAVHSLATPFAGDLDGDGRIEVVVPDNDGYPSTARRMLIFNDSLRLLNSIMPYTPMPNYNTMSNLIADVDNDGKGEIIVATSDRNLACYSMDGTMKWGRTDVYNTYNNGYDCVSLVVADINGDGFSEILAADKIYDGATGTLLVSLPAGGKGWAAGGPGSYMPVFADIDNDGIQEVVGGNTVYKVTITDRTVKNGGSAQVMAQINSPEGFNFAVDGFTSVADIDMDGDLDVIVAGGHASSSNATAIAYVWDGATPAQIGQTLSFSSADRRISRAFAGDITGNGRPDIAFTYTNRIAAYSYDPVANRFTELWTKMTTDKSGATTMSMFDFNQDGEVELVYRDEDNLRIIDREGEDIATIACYSATHTEYPIVLDVDGDGHAEILVSGKLVKQDDAPVYLHCYGSKTPGQWASARRVWNQHAYNTTNIYENLGVPRNPMSPATTFPNDRHPYNAFLQQQTVINAEGIPIWVTPDAVFDESRISTSTVDDSVSLSLCFINQGDAPIGNPVYVTLYRDSVKPSHIIMTDSLREYIHPGDTGCLTVGVSNIRRFMPFVHLAVRLNDNGKTYPVQPECDRCDSVRRRLNPAIYLMMRKNATLNGERNDGTYSNPVPILYMDTVSYEISAVNANLSNGQLIIADTLPPYLDLVAGSYANASAGTYGPLSQPTLLWTIPDMASFDTAKVAYRATPRSGASASQPVYINKAWIRASDTVFLSTNSTCHQGAGVSVVTFSASAGGRLYNAEPQALDYRTSPRTDNLLAVPDEGYRFAGWSHDSYVSLRGETIAAGAGIMHCDTLTVYGDVELRANFAPEEYLIRYYLNGGENAESNPPSFTVESAAITLEAPRKSGDTFTGWTGSNGDEPQPSVTIPAGSTGEREYYANYLYSGREDVAQEKPATDKIWSAGNQAHIRTSRPGSIVRIYTEDGIMREQRAILSAGTTGIRLERGVYIVTLNNSAGEKIVIK